MVFTERFPQLNISGLNDHLLVLIKIDQISSFWCSIPLAGVKAEAK
jgi:hypothetical protein